MDTLTFNRAKVTKSFWMYAIPSVCSFVLVGLYCFVDAYFVGNTIGDTGLAAINISFACISVLLASGTGIGIGAAVKYTVSEAGGREDFAENYLGTANILMIVLSFVIAVPMFVIPKQMMTAMGASESVAELGAVYFRINAVGCLFQLMSVGLIPIIRNCGGSLVAMYEAIFTCFLNMFLDWLFVWKLNFGIAGAAWGTVISQFAGDVICVAYLVKTHNWTFKCEKFFYCCREIIAVGISPFGLSVVPNVTVVVLNRSALALGGDTAIAAYGCMAYLVFVVYLLIQGVGDGVQPLISRYYGEGNPKSADWVKKLTYIVSLSISAVCFLFYTIFSRQLAQFMGCYGSSQEIITVGLPVMSAGFFFVAISRSIASYFYASENNLKCYAVSYCEPLFILLSFFAMGSNKVLNHVWLSNTIGQGLVMILGIVLLISERNPKGPSKIEEIQL